MKLEEIVKDLPINNINNQSLDREVSDIYIGDLLSFVMANGKEGALWLTVQRHLNVIAVAELNEFAGIIFIQGVEPEADTMAKAIELHIPLLKSELDAFQLTRLFIDKGI